MAGCQGAGAHLCVAHGSRGGPRRAVGGTDWQGCEGGACRWQTGESDRAEQGGGGGAHPRRQPARRAGHAGPGRGGPPRGRQGDGRRHPRGAARGPARRHRRPDGGRNAAGRSAGPDDAHPRRRGAAGQARARAAIDQAARRGQHHARVSGAARQGHRAGEGGAAARAGPARRVHGSGPGQGQPPQRGIVERHDEARDAARREAASRRQRVCGHLQRENQHAEGPPVHDPVESSQAAPTASSEERRPRGHALAGAGPHGADARVSAARRGRRSSRPGRRRG